MMFISKATETGREYIPATVLDDRPSAIRLMRSKKLITREIWETSGYRLESCSCRELPELKWLGFVDTSGLVVVLTDEGVRHCRVDALHLFGKGEP